MNSPSPAPHETTRAALDETQARYQSKIDDPFSSHSIILAQAGDGHGRRLLDVGAASGYLAERLTARGFEVTCIEGDPALAAQAKGKCAAVLVADLDGQLPALPGQFDVIVYGDILEHLRDPLRVLRHFNKALAAGGTVIVSVPNVAHLWVRMNLLVGRFAYAERGILDKTHLRFFTRATFCEFLDEAGLEVVRLFATPVPLTLVVPRRYHGWWLRAVHAGSAWLSRVWKTMFAFQFVAVARRKERA